MARKRPAQQTSSNSSSSNSKKKQASAATASVSHQWYKIKQMIRAAMLHIKVLKHRYRLTPKMVTRILLVMGVCIFAIPIILSMRSKEDDELALKLNKQRMSKQQFKKPDVPYGVKEKPVLVSGPGNFEPPPEHRSNMPGEGGERVNKEQNTDRARASVQEYGINMVVSELISYNRTILDTRPSECRRWNYPTNLPNVSVVVVFHNEGLSVIKRTIHSVINRSPPYLLHEILLVDDYSNKADLRQPLEDYIKKFKKVRLLRNKQREGLIRSRSEGAEAAFGEVVLFLDAHCEVNLNWLPPLLAVIHEDRQTMAVPLIDGIDMNTFEYRPVYGPGSQLAGTFEWGLLYKETPIPAEEKRRRQHSSEPWRAPTHAGGLFAIDREYFLKLGGYDAGLEIWGGENFELSFKIWMCGGGIKWVPCSRVGHIYRSFMPYSFGEVADRKGNVIDMNYKRVVEVWMDDYKKYFYRRKPEVKHMDHGDISDQLEFKKRMGCKNFKWYMDNVAHQVLTEYPLLPPNVAWGELRNQMYPLCLDAASGQAPTEILAQPCHGMGGNQQLRLNEEGQLAQGERCLDIDVRRRVTLIYCKLGSVKGPWQYKENTQQMYHQSSKLCIAIGSDRKLMMTDCGTDESYKWKWQHMGDSI